MPLAGFAAFEAASWVRAEAACRRLSNSCLPQRCRARKLPSYDVNISRNMCPANPLHTLYLLRTAIRTTSALPQSAEDIGISDRPSTGWHPLDEPLLWKGSEHDAMDAALLPKPLNPPWKVILLSDGSVTRHLQLMTNLQIKVDCLEMADIAANAKGLPSAVTLIRGPLLQRQVFLRKQEGGKPGAPLVYAASWWNAAEAAQYLQDQEKPIWVSLQGTELLRELHWVYYGNSGFLERGFGARGPFWGRQYVFWHGGKPLTIIYEVFSPLLEEYLGPISKQ